MRVAAVAFVKVVGAVVSHTGHDDFGRFHVLRIQSVVNHHMLIHQHLNAQRAQLVDPAVCARVVLVVAGDEKGAVGAGELRQRRDMVAQLLDAAIHQVAGDGDQVGAQRVHAVDDALQIARLYRRADVDIADLRHAETHQRVRQVRNRHIDAHHLCRAPCVPEAPHSRQ